MANSITSQVGYSFTNDTDNFTPADDLLGLDIPIAKPDAMKILYMSVTAAGIPGNILVIFVLLSGKHLRSGSL